MLTLAGTAAAQPMAYRYGGISGLYTMPQGDFGDIAGDGWGIFITGEQFLNPTRAIAVTTDFGYLDFGSEKFGSVETDINMFPVTFGLRVYPLAGKNPDSKAQLFGQGGMGFYYTRTEVSQGFLGSASNYDYYFGMNAGAGVKLAANPKMALLFDATWNWVFGGNPDPNFLAFRGALMFPVGR
jgi:hypothetical protein